MQGRRRSAALHDLVVLTSRFAACRCWERDLVGMLMLNWKRMSWTMRDRVARASTVLALSFMLEIRLALGPRSLQHSPRFFGHWMSNSFGGVL